MKPVVGSAGISRRAMLLNLAVLPALSGTLLPVSASAQPTASGRLLTSWNDGPAKQALFDFVRATIDVSSPSYVLPDHRIAVQREYAYGPAQGLPDTKVGAFTPALYHEAKKDGWTVISMKDDWERIFAFE
jgi:hypothetical protein